MPSHTETQAAIRQLLDTQTPKDHAEVPLKNWRGVCLHHSWKPEKPRWGVNYGQVFDHFHRNTNGWNNGCGYHFVVSWNPDNPSEIRVWSTYRWKKQLSGAHALNKKGAVGIRYPNRDLVGICFVGDFDQQSLPPGAASNADQHLIEPLLHLLGLEPSPATVYRHSDFDYKSCPGTSFDMARFIKKDGMPPKPTSVMHRNRVHFLEDIYDG